MGGENVRISAPDLEWSRTVLDEWSREHPYECTLCGSKNVILDIKTNRIKCRMCRVWTKNVYERAKPDDKLREMEKLVPEDALEMLQDILSAFTHDHFKQRRQEAINKVLTHTPIALEATRNVITRFGFTDSLEGSMKAIRAIQEHAGDNNAILDGLEKLRQLFCPLNRFEEEEALQRQEEEQQKEREILLQQEQEAERKKMEELSEERRHQALVRAKKAARGLDPNRLYEPVIQRNPAASAMLFVGRSTYLSVIADRADSYQWCLNGTPLSEDAPGYRGTHTSFLKIQYYTKSMAGNYTCRCMNDDGTVESSACVIATGTLKSKQGHHVTTTKVAYGLNLVPHVGIALRPWKHPMQFCSIPLRSYMNKPETSASDIPISISTSLHQPKLYVGLDGGAFRIDLADVVSPPPPSEGTASDSKKNSIPRVVVPSKPHVALTTRARYTTTLSCVRCISTLSNEKWLLVSDLNKTIQLYSITKDEKISQLPCQTITTTLEIESIKTSCCLPYISITYRKSKKLDLIIVALTSYRRFELELGHRSTCVSFSSMGSQVAIGEKTIQHGYLRLMNVETKKSNLYMQGHFGSIQHIQWIPKHAFLFTLGMDRGVKLWDAAKRVCVYSFHIKTPSPTDFIVACSSTMECSLYFSSFAKRIDQYTVESLDHLLEGARIENEKHYEDIMDEIRDAASSLQKLLAALDHQDNKEESLACIQFAALNSRIKELENELKSVIEEKDYWLRRCQNYEQSFTTIMRRTRTNSELRDIADAVESPREVIALDINGHRIENNDDDSIPSQCTLKRAPFRLLQCNDQACEVVKSCHRTIRTQSRAKNNVQLMWDSPPSTVLLVKKPNEPNVTRSMVKVARWLMEEKGLRIYLEPVAHADVKLTNTLTWEDNHDWQTKQHEVDFVISFGGDGTVLWVSSLFNGNVPPVFSFAMGSLGFLTPFDVSNYQVHLSQLIRGGFHMSLRQRLICTIIRANSSPHMENIAMPIHALNEVVVDRGQSAALVELDCYCDDVELTKISADGIIIASPTGSTAYSLSAGGSMTHPSVPCMLFTPICPHTLSFRPLLFHDSAHLKIVVPLSARTSSVMVSFDGKKRVLMNRGDALIVRVSTSPLPSVCNMNENEDWFASVKSNLNWNQRKEIKHSPVTDDH